MKHWLFLLLVIGVGWNAGITQPLSSPSEIITNCTPNIIDFDLIYVRAPRYGDSINSIWPDTVRPLVPDPAADLRLLHPNCTEELLFPLPEHQSIIDTPIGHGSVSDPNISFDGEWVVFTYYHDQSDNNPQRCAGYEEDGRGCLSYWGADIYRLHLPTREVVRLTHQEFTPNSGNGANFDCQQSGTNCPQVGVFNVGPAFVSQPNLNQPAIAFTSTRNNFLPPKPFNGAERTLQLFMMDWYGQNVTQIGYLNNAQALHPFQLADGRLMFTSWEHQGIRDSRQFNLWFIAPDGTGWNSGSGFGEIAIGHHFMTQMSDGDIVVVRYYNLNNNGFGGLVRFPVDPSGVDFGTVHDPTAFMPFQRPDMVDLTRWTAADWELAADFPAPCTVADLIYPPMPCAGGNGSRVGKVTHPAVAAGDGLVLVYTPGAANHNGVYEALNMPYYDGGLYWMDGMLAEVGSDMPAQLQLILNNPNYNEQWPRPVVPFADLFNGQEQPLVWENLSNDGSSGYAALPANSPFGLVGSSSLAWRDTDARQNPYTEDPDPFNSSHESFWAWLHQGADAGIYTNDEIYALRILALIPATDRTYPNNGQLFYNLADERMRILGEIPVRHEGVIDPHGNTDTSFLVRLPADTPFTFQTLDRNGMVLNMAQTWHQLRPGEVRYDCGGCHAHSKKPLPFAETVAGQPDYLPTDMALQTPLLQLTELNGNPTTTILPDTQMTVAYFADIRPILDNRCAGCHTNDSSHGALNLHADGTMVQCGSESWPGTYYRLVLDRHIEGCPAFGWGTPAGTPDYFLDPQITRYLRAFQARESLLVWKLFGARLDGRTNETREGDIDFVADGLHENLLSWSEKATVTRWIELGAPADFGQPWGWHEDDLRPTLWVGPTVEEGCAGTISYITVGVYDLESGLAAGSLWVSLNVDVGGVSAGTNLAPNLNPSNGATLTIPLPQPIHLGSLQAELTAHIQDNAGHTTTLVRAYNQCSNIPSPINFSYLPIVQDGTFLQKVIQRPYWLGLIALPLIVFLARRRKSQ